MTKGKIKAFYIFNYVILFLTASVNFINIWLWNSSNEKYNLLDSLFHKYEALSAFLIIPFFFFAMIFILVKNRKNLKTHDIVLIAISIFLDLFIGMFTLGMVAVRF
ncbi:hypothetical protein [Treponema sp.]|uniref:hypothetical protein n=1 Tax=Treponema sp. TaxID=166 RepID=UPI00298EAAEC|nr:hypothetical protein [Treponema sp.]MCR5613667.1 hypothetical protein [Treponema sp.]